MMAKTKKVLIRKRNAHSIGGMLEDIVGCKWSLSVLELVHGGVVRPGAMQRAVGGLSTKVLNERLRKLQHYGILDKTVFPETPPHVEYRLTKFGSQFSVLLDDVKKLQALLEKQRDVRSS